jgi:hypothetical protein
MSGEFGSFRFGWDGKNRISTSTIALQEATELLPDSFLHAPVPFLPNIVDGGGTGSGDTQLSEDGHRIWSSVPAAVDLIFWQGDDIVIPLYFNDPAVLSDDMADNYAWYAQIRVLPTYKSTFVNDFVTKAVYHPSAQEPPSEEDEYTKVELFLPRSENIYAGLYRWELYSISLQDWSRFPEPADWPEDTPWPPTDELRTWLFGRCLIVPRTSSTDVLPVDAIPPTDAGYTPPAITQNGWVVGPNGRVP